MPDTFSEFDGSVKPICHGSPRPLQELASMKIALNILLAKFNELYPAVNVYVDITELDFHYEGSIAVPQIIKKIIDSKMYPIAVKLNKWVRYINSGLKNLSYDQIYSRFDLVVFGGNGTVHLKDTIANFLQDDSLNNITRFEMAYVYCVEEKIDFFWPLVSCTLSVESLQFDDDYMLYYWICRKKGELDRIPLQGSSSIERRMIENCIRHRNHLAIEYFLTLLNPDDRLLEFDQLLTPDHDDDDEILEITELFDYSGYDVFTCLFPNIDGPMQSQILDKYTTRILYAFVTCLKPVEYSVQCFLYIKDIVTPGCYLHEVIIDLIKYIEEYSDYRRDNGVFEKEEGFWYRQIDLALEQIWLHSSPNLKKRVLENLTTVLDKYSMYDTNCLLNFGREIKFLLALLTDANVQLRNSVWVKYWPYWIDGVPPSQFEELMGLCLVQTEAIENFKSTFRYTDELQYYCDRLIRKGYFIELDEFLSRLYSNEDLVLDVKKHILTNETEIFYEGREAIEKYVNYIDNLISNNVLAANFKDHMFLSTDRILEVLLQQEVVCRNLMIYRNNLCGVQFILSLFVSPQTYPKIKARFLELVDAKIICGRLNPFFGQLWEEFLMWCLDGDNQLLDDFMRSFQIDFVFQRAFFECLKDLGLYETGIFTSLGRFLMYYFKSEAASQNYIRERVEYYERMDAAEVEIIFGRDKQTVIDLMKNGSMWNDRRINW